MLSTIATCVSFESFVSLSMQCYFLLWLKSIPHHCAIECDLESKYTAVASAVFNSLIVRIDICDSSSAPFVYARKYSQPFRFYRISRSAMSQVKVTVLIRRVTIVFMLEYSGEKTIHNFSQFIRFKWFSASIRLNQREMAVKLRLIVFDDRDQNDRPICEL